MLEAMSVAPELVGRVRLGALVLEGLAVGARDAGLAEARSRVGAGLRARHAGERSASVPGVEDARALYKALGLDPTKTRPSNEALLRRVLRGDELYEVNTLVDALNLVSLVQQLPFGLYDLDRVVAPVTLRLGRDGESYAGIRKGSISVAGRPVLVDAEGPFGNPSADSERTCIGTHTRGALVVAYAPAACGSDRLRGILDATRDELTRWCGGRETGRRLLPD